MHPAEPVVIVEDEPDALEALMELLEIEGYRTSGCADAEAAVAAFAIYPNATLITDVDLPTMDGLTLASLVTERYSPKQIIVVSGHSLPFQDHGSGWNILQKPINVEDLLGLLQHRY